MDFLTTKKMLKDFSSHSSYLSLGRKRRLLLSNFISSSIHPLKIISRNYEKKIQFANGHSYNFTEKFRLKDKQGFFPRESSFSNRG